MITGTLDVVATLELAAALESTTALDVVAYEVKLITGPLDTAATELPPHCEVTVLMTVTVPETALVTVTVAVGEHT